MIILQDETVPSADNDHLRVFAINHFFYSRIHSRVICRFVGRWSPRVVEMVTMNRFVNESPTTASSISPNRSKNFRKVSSVVWYGRPPTKISSQAVVFGVREMRKILLVKVVSLCSSDMSSIEGNG